VKDFCLLHGLRLPLDPTFQVRGSTFRGRSLRSKLSRVSSVALPVPRAYTLIFFFFSSLCHRQAPPRLLTPAFYVPSNQHASTAFEVPPGARTHSVAPWRAQEGFLISPHAHFLNPGGLLPLRIPSPDYSFSFGLRMSLFFPPSLDYDQVIIKLLLARW